jgi:hypothetical protein
MRDGVKDPASLTSSDIEGPDMSRGSWAGTFSDGGAEDQQVFVDDARRAGGDVEVKDIAVEALSA